MERHVLFICDILSEVMSSRNLMQWKSPGETYGIMYGKAKDEVLFEGGEGLKREESQWGEHSKKFKGDIVSDVKY